MLSSTMVRAPVRLMAMILVAQMSLGSRGDTQANQIQAEPTRTAKERLGGKASDEQRVDNCKVPPALRGPKPRPEECDDGVSGLQVRDTLLEAQRGGNREWHNQSGLVDRLRR